MPGSIHRESDKVPADLWDEINTLGAKNGNN